jgi:hypothetical protein
MPSILEEYWLGVLDRLQAEVDILARLVQHSGEMGRENEAALQRVLERLIPRKYGIGTGLLIDAKGGYSKQVDIVIHDQEMHPSFFSQTTGLLYPHEVVYGVVEVKTTLRSSDIADIRANCRSIRELYLEPETIYAPRSGTEEWGIVKYPATYPCIAALAYDTNMTPRTIVRHFEKAAEIERPDLLCVLNAGLLGGKSVEAPGSSEFPGGLVVLQPTDSDGNRLMKGFYGQLKDRPKAVPVLGRTYPLVARTRDAAVVEPARALLLFLSELMEMLNGRLLSPTPFARRYLGEQFYWLDPVVTTAPSE